MSASNSRYTVAAALVLALLSMSVLASQRVDYVTEEEENLIRDAQGLKLRAPLFLKLADNRVVALGLRERTAKEKEQAKKDLAEYEREVRTVTQAKVEDAEVRAKPVSPDVYLRNYTRPELLRGYMQVIDELLDNIDDTRERHLEVREHVEAIQRFVREQQPRFQKFEAKTSGEQSAIKAVLAHSEQVLDECHELLAALPKTERKSEQP